MQARHVLLALVAGSSSVAEASTCFLDQGVPALELPAGCPLEVYVQVGGIDPPDGVAIVRADADPVDVTASVASEQVDVDVQHFLLGCDGSTIIDEMVLATPYIKRTFELAGVAVGDDIAPFSSDTSNVWSSTVRVVAAGPCPSNPPPFACTSTFPGPCDNDDPDPDPDPGDETDDTAGSGGCSTGGNGSLVSLLLAGIALIAVRRQRH